MAALQPTVGGLPRPPDIPRKSFAEAVISTSQPSPPSTSSHADVEHGSLGTHKGLPSIAFTDSSIYDLSQPFSWALIGKFSKGYNKKDPKLGRPSVEDLNKYFVSMDFAGAFQIGLLDNRHLFIKFHLESDYLRLYSRMVWYVRGISMRIFKWTPYFRVDKESSVVPIWISLPRLPIQFFQKAALFPIARLLGNPLRLDVATVWLKRPSVARVQVELDVLRERPEKIWIQMGSKEGYWQPVDYENVPPYCCHCWHIGHEESLCRTQQPASSAVTAVQPPKSVPTVHPPQSHLQWRPVDPKVATAPVPPIVSTVPVAPVQANVPTVSVAPVPAPVPTVPVAHVPATVPTVPVTPVPPIVVPAVGSALVAEVPVPAIPVQPPLLVDPAVAVSSASFVVSPSSGLSVHPIISTPSHEASTDEPMKANDVPNSTAAEVSAAFLPQLASTVVDDATVPHSTVALSVHALNGHSPSVGAESTEALVGNLDSTPLNPERALVVHHPNVPTNDHVPATVLTPYVLAFHSPTPSEAYGFRRKSKSPIQPSIISSLPSQQKMHTFIGHDMGDSDYYQDSLGADESGFEDDEATDEYTYEDITDGSEGAHSRKKKDRRKSKGSTSNITATKEELSEQSRILGLRIRHRGRPPGSRNRTYFGMVRTMETRASKSISN